MATTPRRLEPIAHMHNAGETSRSRPWGASPSCRSAACNSLAHKTGLRAASCVHDALKSTRSEPDQWASIIWSHYFSDKSLSWGTLCAYKYSDRPPLACQPESWYMSLIIPCTMVPSQLVSVSGGSIATANTNRSTQLGVKRTAMKSPATMEDVEEIVFVVLGMWLNATARESDFEAARQQTAESNRRVWDTWLHVSAQMWRQRVAKISPIWCNITDYFPSNNDSLWPIRGLRWFTPQL